MWNNSAIPHRFSLKPAEEMPQPIRQNLPPEAIPGKGPPTPPKAWVRRMVERRGLRPPEKTLD